MTWLERLAILAVLVLAAVIGWQVLVLNAQAHDWYSFKRDPVHGWSCCGGNDCAVFKVKRGINLIAQTEGYRIVLSTEEAREINPLARFPIDAVVTWDRVQMSETNDWGLCISAYRREAPSFGIYCLFEPPST